MSEWQSKVWGRTRCLVENELYSLHELESDAGGYCSFHYHTDRLNVFEIVKGTLEIVTVYGPQVQSKILTADERFSVPSLVVHQFRCLEDCTLFEHYAADRGGTVRNDDIHRIMVGGKLMTAGCPSTWDDVTKELFRQWR